MLLLLLVELGWLNLGAKDGRSEHLCISLVLVDHKGFALHGLGMSFVELAAHD